MKELLLADANRLSASHSEYKATRHWIERAEYKTFMLSEADFYDLVFMKANDNVWANNQQAEGSRRQDSENIPTRKSHQSF